MLKFLGVICGLFVLFVPAAAQPQPPIEAYGKLEEVRYAAHSDSGEKIALAISRDGESFVAIYVEGEGYTGRIDTDGIAVRSLEFIGDDHVIIKASEAKRVRGFRGQFDYSAAFAFNLKTNNIKQLLLRTDDIYPGQTGLGKIVGESTDGKLYMLAYAGSVQMRCCDCSGQ